MEQPIHSIFRKHSSAPKAATGTNTRRAAAGSCSFQTVLKSCRELLQKGSRKRRPKTHYFIRLSQVGIDDRAPFFSRQIRWAPPSFQWHNPRSAWLSLRVRASNYRWCPTIDNFLYVWMHKHARLGVSRGILPQEIFRNEIL